MDCKFGLWFKLAIFLSVWEVCSAAAINVEIIVPDLILDSEANLISNHLCVLSVALHVCNFVPSVVAVLVPDECHVSSNLRVALDDVSANSNIATTPVEFIIGSSILLQSLVLIYESFYKAHL